MANKSSIELLRRITVRDIERDGPTSSVMVRAGLLLDIIELALAQIAQPTGDLG